MQVSKISTNSPNCFTARIPRDGNVVAAFEYAEGLLATKKSAKLKEVDKFCSGVRGILEYKPSETLNLNFGKTVYVHSTGKEAEPLFVYYACEAMISNDSISRNFGERATHPKHQKIAPAKLCFDALKEFGNELLTTFSGVKRSPLELEEELESLRTKVLG